MNSSSSNSKKNSPSSFDINWFGCKVEKESSKKEFRNALSQMVLNEIVPRNVL